ncbi:hypothetical protein EYZ11_008194 [Aspergillus tanneri]|uniref:Uncharacterized protein n=1 Tax=Aspergillus tanneri TaxID=1220188 RepID=A0A4S3JBA8_9EURO|nr:hypothetical protein EYZ11_008194 [Aspergillus tanneri]
MKDIVSPARKYRLIHFEGCDVNFEVDRIPHILLLREWLKDIVTGKENNWAELVEVTHPAMIYGQYFATLY